MARIVKSILFLLLVVVLHVAVGNGLVKENLCGDISVLPYSSQQYSIDSMQLPYLPDGELGSVGFYLQQPVSSRTNRTNFDGSAYSLRDMAQVMAEHDAMLVRDWQKRSNSSLLLSIIHPVSEYYIFALRHIII